MLVYSKRIHRFSFIYKEMEFEILYIKEWWENLSGLDSTFEVQGNINHVREVEELLNENEERVIEILEGDLSIESISEEELCEL